MKNVITTPLKRIYLLCIALLFVSYGQINAQNHLELTNPEAAKPAKSIGLNFGTKGLVGIDLGLALNSRFGFRFGYNYLDFKINGYETNFNRFSYYASIDVEVRQSNIELLAEYSFNEGKFRIVTGIAYFFDNMLRGKIQLRDYFRLNDVDLTPEEIGYFQVTTDFSSRISPYLGVSFGKLIPEKRIGFTFDIGTYYKAKPLVDIDATNVIRNNDLNEDVLERNITQYRWWPVLSFRLAYKI